MTEAPEMVWLTVQELAARLGVKPSQVHRLLEERSLLGRRVDGVVRVPEVFLSGAEPLRELRGTVTLLLDDGFSEQEAVDWLLAEEASLGTSPILALHAGRKSEVRRIAQALAF